MAIVNIDGEDKELRDYIVEKLGRSSSNNFRSVDNAIDYIANILDFTGELTAILYEKNLIDDEDLKRLLKDK